MLIKTILHTLPVMTIRMCVFQQDNNSFALLLIKLEKYVARNLKIIYTTTLPPAIPNER